MSIRYAGIPLTPSSAASEAAGAWWHSHRISDFDFQGYFVQNIQHLPTPYFPKREEPRIGVLHWPTGADRFATCHLIATGAEITKLRQAVGTAPTPQPLIFDDGTTQITTDLWWVGTHPISQRGDGKELYLLILVDERYFWWQSGTAETPSSADSWEDLFEQLFVTLGVTATIETVDPAYLTPNMSRWAIGVQPIPVVIQAAANTVGMRVVRDLDGSVRVVNYTTAVAEDTDRWTQVRYECLAGGQVSGADIARGLPESVDVGFFTGITINTTLASLNLSLADGVTGSPSGVGRVTADPANPDGAERTAYAAVAALSYYSWAFSRTDATLRAFNDIQANGLDDCVEWIHTPETMVTRILRPSWSDRNIYGDLFSTGTGSGCTSYKTECENGFLVQYRCESGDEWIFDSSTGVPCEETGTGIGYPFQFDPVTNVCPELGFITEVSENYDATFEDDIIHVVGSSVTVTLPDPVDGHGGGANQLIIKNLNASSATVDGNGADIDGSPTITLAQWESVILYTDGTDWFIMAGA